MRNLIDFAHACVNVSRVKLIFTSSISSASSWSSTRGPYPEEVISDAQFAVGMGYGESKYVSERVFITLLVVFRSRFITDSLQLLVGSGLDISSLRVGQISGGHQNGAWAVTDWVPILVKSSLVMGLFYLMVGQGSIGMYTAPPRVAVCVITN